MEERGGGEERCGGGIWGRRVEGEVEESGGGEWLDERIDVWRGG